MANNKRRSPNEGSIYQRRDGYWVGQYKVGNKTRYIYRKTRKEAASALAKAIAERDSGIIYDSGKLTVSQYLDKWLSTIQNSLRSTTVSRYEVSCRVHIKPTLGRVKLSKLNALQLQDLYDQKLGEGLSPRTVQIIHATLYKSLKQAVKYQLIPTNVAAAAQPPKSSRKEVRPMTTKQVKQLLLAASSDRLEALYILAVTAGIRQGELLGLQWEDVDFVKGTVKIRRTIYQREIHAPKTKNSRRTIRLSKLALTALWEHKEKSNGSEWVFCNRVGKPIRCNYLIARHWQPLLERAGIEYTNFHNTRHTAASLMLQQGVSAKVISSVLGHSSVAFTLDTYAHLMEDMDGLAADAMDRALEDVQGEATEPHS